VAYTFGPNFFLTMVRDSLATDQSFTADLSSLKALISGGESNVVATCDELTRELRRLGIRDEVIRPGFGMTETCAGSIYSRACPSYDLPRSLDFASLGSCIPGIEMRVMSITEPGKQAATGESGEFQVSGPVVFDQYYNNETATRENFTSDGWFITGDLAWIDDAANLNLSGRSKDSIIVNGVKWSSTGLETAIEEEGIAGLVPSFTVAFPTRATGSPTEDIAVVYSPAFAPEHHHARFETATSIAKTVRLMITKKPAHLIPLPQSMLEKSSLGKISRTKVRAALESGEYASIEREDQLLLERYRQSKWCSAETEAEKIVQKTLAELLEMPADEISVDASIFDLGINSFNLILLKTMIQKAVDAKIDIPMSFMLTE
jgi:acyl-CoA synthetase (AMP-forming)/AMP-acid ligase II/acyl carrier protein